MLVSSSLTLPVSAYLAGFKCKRHGKETCRILALPIFSSEKENESKPARAAGLRCSLLTKLLSGSSTCSFSNQKTGRVSFIDCLVYRNLLKNKFTKIQEGRYVFFSPEPWVEVKVRRLTVKAEVDQSINHSQRFHKSHGCLMYHEGHRQCLAPSWYSIIFGFGKNIILDLKAKTIQVMRERGMQ